MKTIYYKILAYLVCLIVITLFYITKASFTTALICGLITTAALLISAYFSKKNKYLDILPSVVFFSVMGGCFAFITKDISKLFLFVTLGIVLWGLDYALDHISKKNRYLNFLVNFIIFLVIGGAIAFITKDIEVLIVSVILGIVINVFNRPQKPKNNYPIPPLDKL